VELVKSASMPHSYESMDSLELSPDNNHFHRHHHDDESDNNKNAGAVGGGDADTQLMGIDLLDGAELSSPEQQHPDDSNGQPNPAVQPAAKNKNNNNNKLTPLKHVRSHTAGRLLQPQECTMERPDIDATIHCVCSVYRAHIENSLQGTAPVATPVAARLNLDIFRDDFELQNESSRQQRRRAAAEVPTVAQIQAFYKEFYQRSQMEHDTIIMSLIYVERLMKLTHGALQPTPENWSSVLISCMILASKVWGECV